MVSFIFKFYAAILLVVGYLISVGYSPEYTAWFDLGPQGLPVNILGYGADKFMQKLSVDKRDPSVFQPDSASEKSWAKRTGPSATVSFLPAGGLTARDPAEVAKYVVPQLEIDGNEDAVPSLKAYLADMAAADERFVIQPSNLDGNQLDSIWLKKKKTWQMVGEFGHVHDEGSAHFILSVPDALEVLQKGWGERHGMAGRMLPLTYMFVYSPRNDDELQEWKRIADAAAAYMTAD